MFLNFNLGETADMIRDSVRAAEYLNKYWCFFPLQKLQ